MNRVFNFNPGPAALPLEVLKKIQEEFLDYKGLGMSVTEISHRSKDFQEILSMAKSDLKDLMELDDNYEILFLQGGASMQFAMIPMNFLSKEESADYVDTGTWSTNAIKEAKRFGKVNVIGSSKDRGFKYIPKECKISENAKYLHLTSNNTIAGTQWHKYPETGNVPIFIDMSSDFLCRPLDYKKFALIYAGAQKNIGPAGVTIVAINKNLMEKANKDLPTMLNYQTFLDKDSCFNTPPVFAIYVVGLVAQWIKKQGGLTKIEEINNKKAKLIYDVIDEIPDFYKAVVDKEDRSIMNINLRLNSEELEEKFIKESKAQNLIGLKGHRSVGGIRASIYNSVSLEAVEKLVEFMKDFASKNK